MPWHRQGTCRQAHGGRAGLVQRGREACRADRRHACRLPRLWRREDIGDAAEAGGGTCHPLQGVQADGAHGHPSVLSAPVPLGSRQGVAEVPISPEGQEHPVPQPGMVDRHHLCPDRREAHVSHRRHRLVQPLHGVLEALGHHEGPGGRRMRGAGLQPPRS